MSPSQSNVTSLQPIQRPDSGRISIMGGPSLRNVREHLLGAFADLWVVAEVARLRQRGARFARVAEPEIHEPGREPGALVARIDREPGLELLQRLVGAAEVVQREAQVVVELHVLRVDGEQLLVERRGLRVVAARERFVGALARQ